MQFNKKLTLLAMVAALGACGEQESQAINSPNSTPAVAEAEVDVPDVVRKEAENLRMAAERKFASEPLVSNIYTADPSAHVWNDTLYIYPSHDIETDIPMDDTGAHFAMRDYHVLSMTEVGGEVTDHGVALDVDDVPWAEKQMWAPDAAKKGDKYYLYFPAKDYDGIFHIGAAVSDSPTGPFVAEPEPIEGSYSMDPTVYKDTDGEYYMYIGGIRSEEHTSELQSRPHLVCRLLLEKK